MKKNSTQVENVVPLFDYEQLPVGWEMPTIGDICLKVHKVNPKDKPDTEFNYIDISGIDNEYFKIASTKHYSGIDAPSRARQLVHGGDIVFSTVRTYLKNFARVTHELDGQIASTGFCVLRAANEELSKYLFYYVQYEKFLNKLAKFQRGTSYPAVRNNDVLAQFIPVPPKGDAIRIVAEIEKQFSRLDEAVANLKRIKTNLKRYKAAVLKAAVEGKLTEEWRKQNPDVEPADKLLERILAERQEKWQGRGKYKKPVTPDTTDLPKLPVGWCWASIGQIVECLDSKRVPINKKERATRQGQTPYYGANGQVGWIDDYLFDEPLILVVEDETFTGRELPFSYKITGKSWVNNHAHVLKCTDAVNIDFLNNALCFYPFIPLTTGTTGRKKLTQRALMGAILRLPPLEEQQQIVYEVEHRLSIITKAETQIDANLHRATCLRQSILKKAFSGKLVSNR